MHAFTSKSCTTPLHARTHTHTLRLMLLRFLASVPNTRSWHWRLGKCETWDIDHRLLSTCEMAKRYLHEVNENLSHVEPCRGQRFYCPRCKLHLAPALLSPYSVNVMTRHRGKCLALDDSGAKKTLYWLSSYTFQFLLSTLGIPQPVIESKHR